MRDIGVEAEEADFEELKPAGQPEFKTLDIIDRLRRDDAVDQFNDMPKSFSTLDDVRMYLRNLAAEQRRQITINNVSSPEGLTARNLLATMYEQIASGNPDEITDFSRRQKEICEQRLSELRTQLGLLQPNIEVVQRIQSIPTWPYRDLGFSAEFLQAAQHPEFYEQVLGRDFLNSTRNGVERITTEQKSLDRVNEKWGQAIKLASTPPSPKPQLPSPTSK